MNTLLKTNLVTALIFLAVPTFCYADSQRNPAVIGPIVGGQQGKPYSAPALDLAQYGYRMEEYFLDGYASGYQFVPGSEKTPDGRWKVRSKGEKVPYRTRILVVRPIRQEDFNGTVVLHWQNVTAGYELGSVGTGEYLRGYTWVGVSAQKIGVDGVPGPTAAGLRQWDRQRYGSLVHPGDAYSYDIFTQAAKVVAANRSKRSNDPMAGLRVERLIAAGASQSASRLRTYINGVQPIENVFHGLMPYIDFASTIPFSADAQPRNRGRGPRVPTRIRDDLQVPVFVVNSETETLSYLDARQPDTDKFRFWEVTGSSHVSIARILPGSEAAQTGLESPNWHSYTPAYDAALRHMHVWLKDGTPPPITARIKVAKDKTATIERDKYGNALGGIQLPDFAVPTAEHRGTGSRTPGGNRFAFLYGYSRDFTSEELKAHYANEKAFKAAYERAVAASIKEGVMLAEDAAAMRERAFKWIAGRL